MPSKQLKRSILEKIVEKTGNVKQTVRNRVSELKRDNPRLTSNAAAYLYAKDKGFSVLQSLGEEDKKSLPNTSEIRIIKTRTKTPRLPKQKNDKLFDYETSNPFKSQKMEELHRQ